MKIDVAEAVWAEDQPAVDLEALSQLAGLPREVVEELVDCGVLAPLRGAPQWQFPGDCVATVRIARRVRQDFELESDALAVVMKLVERIQRLEATVRDLKARGAH
jgi:chaperone modulatory protein CbpM